MQTVHFVHSSTKPGGLESKMPLRLKSISNYKTDVFVIRPPDGKSMNVYKDLSVKVTYGSNSSLIALLKFFFFALRNRKGIFHLFNTGPYFLFVLRLVGVKKVVYSIHGSIYWKTAVQRSFRKFFWKLAIKPQTILTSNSEYSAKVFCDLVNDKVKPIVLNNPMDVSKFNLEGKGTGSVPMKIIYVGRLVSGKNLMKWLDIAGYLIEKKINATFELYGTGPMEMEMKQKVGALGLGEKVFFMGHNDSVELVYKNSDLLLFLSEYESFGNVAVESVLCGTPVLVYNIPSMKEIFKDIPEFIIEQNEGEKEMICNKILKIAELKNAALKASSVFSERFGSDDYSGKLENIYAKLH